MLLIATATIAGSFAKMERIYQWKILLKHVPHNALVITVVIIAMDHIALIIAKASFAVGIAMVSNVLLVAMLLIVDSIALV